jgi:hypothetical protein
MPKMRLGRRAQLAVRRKDPVIPRQVHAWRWHQRGQSRHQIQWLHNNVRRAIAVGSLGRIVHMT